MTQISFHDHFLTGPDGFRIAARRAGPDGGIPIILIAGWPQTLHAWRHVQDGLARLGVRSIALDPPGLGGSDLLGEASNYATSDLARRMSAILTANGIDRFVLAGHDLGAWIAFAWARLKPDGVAALALMDAQIPGALPDGFLSIGNAVRVFQFCFNAVPDLPERLTLGREQIYLDWLFETKTRVKGAIGPEDVAIYMQSFGQPERMVAGFHYYRAVPDSISALENAPPLSMPVLALAAEHGVGPVLAKALEGHSADVEGHVIEGVGHYIPEEAPDAVCDSLKALWAKVSAP